jgi:hypothetical protein
MTKALMTAVDVVAVVAADAVVDSMPTGCPR